MVILTKCMPLKSETYMLAGISWEHPMEDRDIGVDRLCNRMSERLEEEEHTVTYSQRRS